MGNCVSDDLSNQITYSSPTTKNMDTKIVSCCGYGTIDEFKKLIKKKYNYSDLHYANDVALNRAIEYNKVDILRYLVSLHPDGIFKIHWMTVKKYFQYEEKYNIPMFIVILTTPNIIFDFDVTYHSIKNLYSVASLSDNVHVFENKYSDIIIKHIHIIFLDSFQKTNIIYTKRIFDTYKQYIKFNEHADEIFIQCCLYPQLDTMKFVFEQKTDYDQKIINHGLSILKYDYDLYNYVKDESGASAYNYRIPYKSKLLIRERNYNVYWQGCEQVPMEYYYDDNCMDVIQLITNTFPQ
jgi:hypothetical protein